MRNRQICVGLTGGIGSGKTAAAKVLERCGAAVINADRVASEIIDKNRTVKKRIIEKFGTESYLPEGHLDRRRMAKMIFRDKNLQEQLNAIVHPAVIREIERAIRILRAEKKYKIAVVDAALIFEAGVQDRFDYIIVVDAEREIRIGRMMKRSSEPERNIRARMKSQLPNRMKIQRADFVIKNNGTLKDLEQATRFMHRLLVQSLNKAVRK